MIFLLFIVNFLILIFSSGGRTVLSKSKHKSGYLWIWKDNTVSARRLRARSTFDEKRRKEISENHIEMPKEAVQEIISKCIRNSKTYPNHEGKNKADIQQKNKVLFCCRGNNYNCVCMYDCIFQRKRSRQEGSYYYS